MNIVKVIIASIVMLMSMFVFVVYGTGLFMVLGVISGMYLHEKVGRHDNS